MKKKIVTGSIIPIKRTYEVGILFRLENFIPFIFKAQQIRKIKDHGGIGEALFDFPVPPGVCALRLFRGMICALSTEADSVSAYDPDTGQMLYAAPAGTYPRDLCAGGRWLAAAGPWTRCSFHK